jgi:nicotinamide mononucleotide adenylyltransferase
VKTPILVHGRFQPFHNDHLRYLREALCRYEKVGIGLTGVYRNRVADPDEPSHRRDPSNNPFTYLQRMEMIQDALMAEGIASERVFFLPFPIEVPELLLSVIGPDALMLTTVREAWNEHKVEVLKSLGYRVEVLYEDFNKAICGSVIRRMMLEGNDAWKDQVPTAVSEYIKRLK